MYRLKYRRYSEAIVQQETPIIIDMRQELATGVRAPSWKSQSGRDYLAFNVDPREPPARVPIVAESRPAQ